jgi:hypothetical protein
MKIARLLAAALASFSILAPAGTRAADSGDCTGAVFDENGVPVATAGIKFENSSGQSFRTETDGTGRFALRNLPAGDYKVEVRKAGFFLLTGQSFTLHAGPNELTLTLSHEQEIHEQVQVTALSGQIDAENTSQQSTLTANEIRDIPVPSSHTLQQSLVALPQVLRDNQDLLHIAGARSTQAQYLLNGFEIGDPVSGVLDAQFSVDAVRTAEVRTGRFGAEFAHPAAAILSFDTPDGDDRWRFNATDFIPGINVQNGVQFGNFYPRFLLSGPIECGKLWFSEAISLQHTLSIVKGQPSDANQINQWSGSTLTRILWHSSVNNSVQGSFLYNRSNLIDLGLDSLHPQSATVDLDSHRLFGSVKDQLWAHQTLFELGLAADESYTTILPQGSAPYILLVNGAEGNYFQALQERGRRYQILGDAIRTSLHWHGTHTFSVGANLSSVELIQSSTRGEIQALRSDLTLSRLSTFAGSGTFHVSNTLAGGFVQDTWTPNRYLVAQIGLRTDWDRFVQLAMAEPRVSVNILPWADNRGKFSIGWGIYNIPLNLSVIGQAEDQQQVDSFYDATGKVPVAGPAVSQFAMPSGGVKQSYFDIASVGWQQRFGANTIVSIDLLARDEHHGQVYETQTPGQIGSVFLLQSSRRDKYRDATFTARHTFSNGAELFGSYTRSLANTDQDLDPVLGSLYFAAQQPGPLSWNAPNRFLSWASIPTPIWGLLFSYFFEYRSGYPFSVVNQQQFLIGAPNSQLFPDYASLTVALEKKFRFSHRLFAVRVAVINVLRRENPDVVVNNIDAPNFLTFSGGQGRALTARLRFIGRK